jgi:metallo-beta-lactamase family protein
MFVARMERSAIRDRRCKAERLSPDVAALRPGYETVTLRCERARNDLLRPICAIILEIGEPTGPLELLFSGDLGNAARPLLRPPVPPPQADLVVMETTYGDREHKSIGPSIAELYHGIAGAFARGGNVIIPTFALERAQELLFVFHEGQEQGRLSRAAQVFLDSPLAISATEIFGRHPEGLEPRVAKLIADGGDPFRPT